MERYGYDFELVHKWMDEPVKIAMGGHRKMRHNYKTTPKEAEEIFWDLIPNEFRPFIKHAVIDHLILDNRTNKKKKLDEIPIYFKLDEPKNMRYVIFHLEKMKILCNKIERDLEISKKLNYSHFKTPRYIADNFGKFIYDHTRNSIKHYPPNKKVEWVINAYKILEELEKIMLKINGIRVPFEIQERMMAKELIDIKDRILEIVEEAHNSIETTKETEKASVQAMAEMKSIDEIFTSARDLLKKVEEDKKNK